MLWITPIVSRSQSDVDYSKSLIAKGWASMSTSEQTAWLNGLQGSLNTSDLARIESNVKLLSDVLELHLTTYAGNIPQYPNESYFTNLIANVETIRSSYSIHQTTPTTPAAPVNEFSKINAIEQILLDVYTIIMSNFDYYCDSEMYCDSDIIF